MFSKDKINFLNFSPTSQYACTKCIKYRRILNINEVQVGAHIAFERNMQFYHAILSNITNVQDSGRVQMHIIHASCTNQLSLVKSLFGKDFKQHDTVVQEVLPELDAASVGLHLVQYGRPTYEHEKILRRALALVEKNRGQVVPVGSLSSQKIRPEAQFRQHAPNITSGHFASWCATGENFSFDVKEKQKMIKYTREQNQISMSLEMFSDEDPVQKITERHQQQLICDSCFLKELTLHMNSLKCPEKTYRLISTNAWTKEKKIPKGLYRVTYTPTSNEVVINIKHYNSKFKRLASESMNETFVFTLIPDRNVT
ncbi:uncharacterized protein LOC127719649 [Mytilus californianus]|uniref:uncharacterized protein LOC127719649 n=1 Tax=Mytilus californianus TaxID=6549 RepID=UPI002248758D|nr:uncharacterized protein LOC127719649 [Mytilus californianus]